MNRALTLYAIRHGETEDNVSGIITAQADSPLTARGHEQARVTGVSLKELLHGFDGMDFAASPLHRACVTMELVRTAAGLHPTPYATDRRLMEMNFGDWTKIPEGRDRYKAATPTAHHQWNLVCPGGESQQMVHARVGAFLETLARDTVIVCHARTLCMVRAHMLGLSPEETMRYEPKNAGILRLSMGTETYFGA